MQVTSDANDKNKKAYLVSLKHKLKSHLQLQSASANQVDRRWLNGFMAAGFHSGLISLSERYATTVTIGLYRQTLAVKDDEQIDE